MSWRLVLFLLFAFICANAQQPSSTPAPAAPATDQPARQGRGGQGSGRGGFAREGSTGAITAINGSVLTIKTTEDKTVIVNTTANTRFMGKDRSPAALKDLKVGDYVMAGGQTGADGAVDARMVVMIDEQAVKRMQEMQANMGKTVIAGEVKEINDTKLTVLRPDGQTQVIELDENSSMKKQNESITLADIKPGDRINGTGELKNGTFMVKELRVGGGGQGQRRTQETKTPDKP